MKPDYMLIHDNSRPACPQTNSKTLITQTHSHQDLMLSILPPSQQKVVAKPRRPHPQLHPPPVLKTSPPSSIQQVLRHQKQKSNPFLRTRWKMDAGALSPCRVTIHLLIGESQNGSVGLVMTMIWEPKMAKLVGDDDFLSLMHLLQKAKMNPEV